MSGERMKSARRLTIAIGLACVWCAGTAKAQDATADAARPEAKREHRDAQMSPERVRERLGSLLVRLEDATERIRSAIGILDEGGTVEDAIESLGGPMRARRLAEFWGGWLDGGEEESGSRRPFADRWRQRQAGDDEAVFPFLREHAPEMAARMDELREQDPERAEMLAGRLRSRVAEVIAARARDPELGELATREFRVTMELMDVGRRFARADATGHESAAELETQVRGLAAEQVDLRLARRELEISRLAEQLEALRAEVETQRGQRDGYIDEIVERTRKMDERGGPDDRRQPPRPERGSERGSDRRRGG